MRLGGSDVEGNIHGNFFGEYVERVRSSRDMASRSLRPQGTGRLKAQPARIHTAAQSVTRDLRRRPETRLGQAFLAAGSIFRDRGGQGEGALGRHGVGVGRRLGSAARPPMRSRASGRNNFTELDTEATSIVPRRPRATQARNDTRCPKPAARDDTTPHRPVETTTTRHAGDQVTQRGAEEKEISLHR